MFGGKNKDTAAEIERMWRRLKDLEDQQYSLVQALVELKLIKWQEPSSGRWIPNKEAE